MEKYFKEVKNTFNLALPVIIGQLGHILLGITDSLMVGHVGPEPLAASSLVNSILILVLILGIGMSIAITPLVAIAKGKNDFEHSKSILSHSLTLNTVFSILLAAILFLMSFGLELLNQPQEVIELAKPYMQIMSLSIIPFMLFQTYRQFIEGLSFTKPAMYVALLSNVVNVIGNWILIYGKFGAPALGLNGAGIASFITRVAMAIFMFLFFIKNKNFTNYHSGFKLRNFDFPLIKKIINIGIPSGFTSFFEVGAFSFASIMMGWLGKYVLAAHQIAISIASVSFMIILGISSAATIRIGTALGEKNYNEMKTISYSSILLAASIMGIFGLIFFFNRYLLANLFVENETVINIATGLIIVAAFFQLSDGVQAVSIGVLRGMTDVKIPMYITFSAYWIVGLPIGYYLAKYKGFNGVGIWIGLLIGLTFAAIFFVIRIRLKLKRYLENE